MSEFQRFIPRIEQALEYAGGTHTALDVLAAIGTDHLQFWPGADSFLVTELEVYPRKKVCHIFLAGGHLDELQRMLRGIEAWAVTQGCQAVTLTGRAGWAKSFLKHDGYEVKWTAMAKELS